MRILSAAVEFAPYTGHGPLGETVSNLAQALKRSGAELTLLAPYQGDGGGLRLARRLSPLSLRWGGQDLELPLWEGTLPGNVRVILLEHESFVRPDGVYGDAAGPYPDNAQRFGLFCAAVAAAACGPLSRFEVLHLHDWACGLVPYYLSQQAGPKPITVFSVYDLANQGHYPASVLPELGIPATDFHPEGLEFYGHLNFLKAGLLYSDGIVTMGRAHRREVLSEEGGHGMAGLLRHRGDALGAVPLGIDAALFDPEQDPALAMAYSVQRISGKRACKRALQDELGLEGRSDVPVLGLCPPLAHLAPLPELLAGAEAALQLGLQLAILPGLGEPAEPWQAFAEEHAERCGLLSATEESSLHQLLAGGDLLAVPNPRGPGSRAQSLAMRYGTLPLVHGKDVLETSGTGLKIGFEYGGMDRGSLQEALQRALRLFSQQKEWRLRMLEGMALDFTWAGTAERYLRFFRRRLQPTEG